MNTQGVRPLTMMLRTDDGPVVVEHETVEGVKVVRFRSGTIFSDDNARELGEGLGGVLDGIEPKQAVVVDLHGIPILSSAAIAKLIVFRRRVRERGCELRFCRPSVQVARTFRIANLWDFLGIFSDFDAAVDSIE